jgi:hypothetical protein
MLKEKDSVNNDPSGKNLKTYSRTVVEYNYLLLN